MASIMISHMAVPWDSVYSHAEAFLQSHNRRASDSSHLIAPQQQQQASSSLHHAKQLLHSLRAAALDSALLAVAAAEKAAVSALGLISGTADQAAPTASLAEGEERAGGASKGSKAAAAVL